MERVGDRLGQMERYCSTGQSPQRAVAPMEEEEFTLLHTQPENRSYLCQLSSSRLIFQAQFQQPFASLSSNNTFDLVFDTMMATNKQHQPVLSVLWLFEFLHRPVPVIYTVHTN